MRRVLCVGNRLAPEDDAGPRVFDLLAGRPLPAGVEVIDGGLAGLDLARFVDGAERVVVVDAVRGFAPEGGVIALSVEEASAGAEGGYGHDAGLPYLLRALPVACEHPVPPVFVVGIEGRPGPTTIERAADLALRLLGNSPRPGSSPAEAVP